MSEFEPIPERRGQCFVYAYRWVDTHPEWTLVHGYLAGRAVEQHNGRYDHAWCRLGVVLYEPLVDKVFDYSEYAIHTDPVALHTYTFNDMQRLAHGTGHYGPWTREQRRALLRKVRV